MKRLIIKWLGVDISSFEEKVAELEGRLSAKNLSIAYEVQSLIDFDVEMIQRSLSMDPEFIKALVKAINEYQVR